MNWKPRKNGSLRGFFDVRLPSDLVIHGCMLHEKGDRRWIALPAQEYESQGERKFAPIVTFADRAADDRFRERTLNALDQHFAEATDGQKQRI
jgi:hypothetical protein